MHGAGIAASAKWSPPKAEENADLVSAPLEIEQQLPDGGVFHLELHDIALSLRAAWVGGWHDRLAKAEIQWRRDVLAGHQGLSAFPVLEHLHYVEAELLAGTSSDR